MITLAGAPRQLPPAVLLGVLCRSVDVDETNLPLRLSRTTRSGSVSGHFSKSKEINNSHAGKNDQKDKDDSQEEG